MKTLVTSKTFWFAVAKGVSGIGVAALTELNMVGALMVLVAITDVILRMLTTEPIKTIV